ncbi:hypothetical protein C8R45DRAFT_921616 [Mycena sanguinolenta]|nr:hypothetical protein C8R45DRAFT_921616 [Mycena sanguinolenta]
MQNPAHSLVPVRTSRRMRQFCSGSTILRIGGVGCYMMLGWPWYAFGGRTIRVQPKRRNRIDGGGHWLIFVYDFKLQIRALRNLLVPALGVRSLQVLADGFCDGVWTLNLQVLCLEVGRSVLSSQSASASASAQSESAVYLAQHLVQLFDVIAEGYQGGTIISLPSMGFWNSSYTIAHIEDLTDEVVRCIRSNQLGIADFHFIFEVQEIRKLEPSPNIIQADEDEALVCLATVGH